MHRTLLSFSLSIKQRNDVTFWPPFLLTTLTSGQVFYLSIPAFVFRNVSLQKVSKDRNITMFSTHAIDYSRNLTTYVNNKIYNKQASVVLRADNFIHWISRYPAEQMYSSQYFWQVFRHTIPVLKFDICFYSVHYRTI